MKIKSVSGGSHGKPFDSKLDSWNDFSGISISYCPVAGCLETDIKAAYVRIVDGQESNLYVCPLCEKHAASTTELVLTGKYQLLAANTAKSLV